jgi:hypothetical protein
MFGLFNKNKTQLTWRRKNSTEKSRMDFWLVEDNAVPLVVKSDIRPACIYTDHQAIFLKTRKWLLEDEHFLPLRE